MSIFLISTLNKKKKNKHDKAAILKMKKRFEDKQKHPMYGKKHSIETKLLLSKPGILNPMYGKKHSDLTKIKMKMASSKFRIDLYDINHKLLNTFNNNVELATFLNIHKSTVGRYIKSNKIYKNMYYFKKVKKS
jgi:group I intron endonuclease